MSADPTGSGGAEIPEISPADLNSRIAAGESFVIVDVREAFERDIADLPDYGQIHIPMAEVESRLDELDPSERTVVYCRSGGRSGMVLRFLRQRGFEDVINLRGGVLGWRDEVDPTLAEY